MFSEGAGHPWALYDGAAAVTGDDVPFEAARERFDRSDALRVPRTVFSDSMYLGPRRVTLRPAR